MVYYVFFELGIKTYERKKIKVYQLNVQKIKIYKAKTTNITPNPIQIRSLQQLSPAILLFPSIFTDGIVVLPCKL